MFSKFERLVLVNQYRILEKLSKDQHEAEGYRQCAEIFERGYEGLYNGFTHNLSDPFSDEKCREVLEILEMFSVLKLSYEELSDQSGIDQHYTNFWGFDGNNETRQMAFAEYFCKLDGGRYEDLEIKNFNSHSPTLETYRRMLREWRACRDEMPGGGPKLSREALLRITAAAIHPDNRQ